jgi:hypothetical protein
LEERAEQVLPRSKGGGGGGGGGQGQRGKVAQTMYIHMNNLKNKNIK